MIRLFVPLLFLFSLQNCENDIKEVSLTPSWSNGDSYQFNITKISRQWSENNLVYNDSTKYLANFKIITSTQDGYKIRWSYKNDLADMQLPENLLVRFLKYQMIAVIYTTTKSGEYIRIENLDAIKKLMVELNDEYSKAYSKLNFIDRQAIETLIKIYSSKEGIEQVVLSDIQFFHFPFGQRYKVAERFEFEEDMPNMLGGEPFKGHGEIFVESINSEKNRCVIVKQVKLYPEESKKMMSIALKSMGLSNQEIDAEIKNAKSKFEINYNNHFDYHYNPAIPIKISAKKEYVFDIGQVKGERIEETLIELIE